MSWNSDADRLIEQAEAQSRRSENRKRRKKTIKLKDGSKVLISVDPEAIKTASEVFKDLKF